MKSLLAGVRNRRSLRFDDKFQISNNESQLTTTSEQELSNCTIKTTNESLRDKEFEDNKVSEEQEDNLLSKPCPLVDLKYIDDSSDTSSMNQEPDDDPIEQSTSEKHKSTETNLKLIQNCK